MTRQTRPMKNAFVAMSLAALASCAQTPSRPEAALVSLGGEGEFVEVERTESESRVEVRRAPAGSVPSSLYTLRGVCAVLRARGAAYVSSEQLPGPVPTYRLTFPATMPAEAITGRAKRVFTPADCALLHF